MYNLEKFDLTKKQKACRFNSPVFKEKIDALVDQCIPVNTKKMTSWSIEGGIPT